MLTPEERQKSVELAMHSMLGAAGFLRGIGISEEDVLEVVQTLLTVRTERNEEDMMHDFGMLMGASKELRTLAEDTTDRFNRGENPTGRPPLGKEWE